MSKIYTSATQLIGHTPLLKVNNYLKDQNIEGVELLAKLEYFNPAGSVKDRIALAMIEDAEKKGIFLKKAPPSSNPPPATPVSAWQVWLQPRATEPFLLFPRP